jgi:hypothetical protein
MKKKKTHNMFSLMLDPQFFIFHLVFSFVGHEQNIFIVGEYDWKPL